MSVCLDCLFFIYNDLFTDQMCLSQEDSLVILMDPEGCKRNALISLTLSVFEFIEN